MKIHLILKLYDILSCGGFVLRTEFCEQNKIAERTFYRYMHEIAQFLKRFRDDCVIDVQEPDGKYFIKRYKCIGIAKD